MVRVKLKPSRRLAIALVAAHLGAVGTVFPLDLPLWAKASLVLLVIASLLATLWRHALLTTRTAVVAIELHDHDRAALQTRDGRWHDARVLETTYVSPLLTVLNLRTPGRLAARYALIAGDNADREDYRRLRVWLRWGYRKQPQVADPVGNHPARL